MWLSAWTTHTATGKPVPTEPNPEALQALQRSPSDHHASRSALIAVQSDPWARTRYRRGIRQVHGTRVGIMSVAGRLCPPMRA